MRNARQVHAEGNRWPWPKHARLGFCATIIKIVAKGRAAVPQALYFLKPRLMQPCTAIAVPLHYCVFFIRPFNSAQFSRRLPEIAQTLDAISGIYFQLLWRRLDEWWPLGSVCISRCSSVRQWWLRSLAQFGRRIGSVHWFHEEKATPFIRPPPHSIGSERGARMVETAQS
jgi:hypothetical protein